MNQAYLSGIPSTDRILRWPELHQKVGYSRTNIYYLTEMGDFPKSVKLGGRAVGWLESEIDQWIRDRVALSREGEQ
jgi:prophage regulatory protein